MGGDDAQPEDEEQGDVTQDAETGVLAAVPMAFSPFAPTEIEELERFRTHMGDFETRQLAIKQSLKLDIGSGGVMLEDFDADRFSGLATAFRKVGWANEPATFGRVTNLLGKHARQMPTPEASVVLGWLGAIRDLRRDMLRQSRFLGWVLERQGQEQKVVRPKEVLDLLLNGYLMHGDAEKRRRWDELGGLRSPGLVMIATLTMWDLLALFRAVDQIVERVLITETLRV